MNLSSDSTESPKSCLRIQHYVTDCGLRYSAGLSAELTCLLPSVGFSVSLLQFQVLETRLLACFFPWGINFILEWIHPVIFVWRKTFLPWYCTVRVCPKQSHRPVCQQFPRLQTLDSTTWQHFLQGGLWPWASNTAEVMCFCGKGKGTDHLLSPHVSLVPHEQEFWNMCQPKQRWNHVENKTFFVGGIIDNVPA